MDYLYTNSNFSLDVLGYEMLGKDYEGLFQGHSQNGNNLTLHFSQALTTAQEDDLDLVMASHPSLEWRLIMYLAAYRWGRETGGIMSQGYGIDTSDRSKVLINGAYNKVKDDQTPAATMDFKTATGWTILTHTEVENIALDVAAHVEKCFHAEKLVDAKIWAGTLTTELEVATEFEVEYAAA